jgi:hypothetical protein
MSKAGNERRVRFPYALPLKIDPERKESHVDSRVYVGNSGVGHVLKTYARRVAIGDSPIQADVAGELEIIAEIPGTEPMLAEKSRSGATFECNGEPAFAQLDERSNRADERAGIVAEPANGRIRARAQVPVRTEIPAAGEGDPAKDLGLVKGVALQRNAAAHAHKKILRATTANHKNDDK